MAKILVVEDSPSMRSLIAMTLSDAGHEVIKAEDGVAAEKTADENDVDMVVTDINMPRMDGITLIATLRK